MDCIIFGLQRFGGISNYWARLLESMHRLDADCELILPKAMRFEGLDAARIGASRQTRETLPSKVTRYLRADAASRGVFHTSYYRQPRRSVDRYVVTVYDFIYELYRTGLPRWVHTHQKLASIKSADCVVCISHSTKRDVLQFCPTVDPANVHVVQLGVDFNVYFPDKGDEPVAHDRVVLFVGQRTGYKRFQLAVDALRQCGDLVLGVVGPVLSADERERLNERLGARWIEYGPVSSARLRNLYSTSFAFMFPSDYEGFGLPILEAMACGCPVITSSAASLPEVGGSAASYAAEQRPELYASALDALRSSQVRDKAIAAGLSRCQQFSWERTCAQTAALYGLHDLATKT